MISSQEYNALKAFYNSTNGNNWSSTCSGWSFTTPPTYSIPCKFFYGVKCNTNCNVTQINLDDCNLVGNLPSALDGLSTLRVLSVGSNSIKSIPSSLFMITSLRQLNLSNNFLTFSVPSEVGMLSNLLSLDLSNNKFNGSIPVQLFQLKQLIYLSLSNNSIMGTIPKEISNLQNLSSLGFDSNKLSGTLPAEIWTCTNMEFLYLQSNNIIGTLANEVGNLAKVQYFYTFSNKMTGTIPQTVGGLTSVSRFWLFDNMHTGTIPTTIGKMTNMWDLNLNTNRLTGTIISELGNLSKLVQLYLSQNFLSGTIPTQLTAIPLACIWLNNNKLTGTIPSQFGDLPLHELWLFSNYLKGTIPSKFGNLTHIENLLLYNNSLTGSIPSQLGNLKKINYLLLYDNSLVGTLPYEISNLTQLRCFNVEYNRLSGPIPNNIDQLKNLRYLYLTGNAMTGSLPSALSRMDNLRYLYLQNNKFTGNIPITIITNYLVAINLSGNKLKGNLQQLFNTSRFSTLQYLVMSNLLISGSIPDTLFKSKIESVVLSGNCITNTIPISVCNATSMKSLVLDGVSSSQQCSTFQSKNLISSKTYFGGSIPNCLFALPNLETLHLAGNVLSGTLPELPSNSSLRSLSLSNNRLIGSVPKSVLMHGKFVFFDISNNKITGIVDNFVSDVNGEAIVLNMTINRLSGSPIYINSNNVTLNILQGNLFSCPTPQNDIHRDSVECGSRNYSLTYSIFVILILIFFATIHTQKELWLRMKSNSITWWSEYKKNMLSANDIESQTVMLHTLNYIDSMEALVTMSLILSVFFLLVVMMTYITLKIGYGSSYSLYQFQYLYTPTIAFLHGTLPSIALIVFMSVAGFLTITFLSIKPKFQSECTPEVTSLVRIEDESLPCTYHDQIKKLNLGLHFMITSISLMINFGFVGIVYYTNISPIALSSVQFVYAGMKSILIQVYIPWASKFMLKSSRQIHIVVMIIMVMIVSPALATLFISPLCLYKKFHSNDIEVSYTYPQFNYGCVLRGLYYHCGFYKIIITESEQLALKWSYSYQCSSSLLTSYLTNFTFVYIINGILLPAFNALTMFENELMLKLKNICFKCFQIYLEDYNKSIFRIIEKQANFELSSIPNRNDNSRQSINDVKKDHSSPKPPVSDSLTFSVMRVFPQLCVDITILLTFGLASPILALLIAFHMVVNLLLWRLAIGRYFCIASKVNSRIIYLKRLEEIFKLEWDCFKKSWFVISVFIGLYWSMFVNDMIGDFNETGGLIGSFLTLVWFPLLFTATSTLANRQNLNVIQSKILVLHNIIWTRIIPLGSIRSNIIDIKTTEESVVDFTMSPLS